MAIFYLELEHTQQVGCLQKIVCVLASCQKPSNWQQEIKNEFTLARTDAGSI